MRGYGALTTALFKSQVREPVGFFFAIVFSPAVLIILGLIFGNNPAPEFGGSGFVDRMAPGMTAITGAIIGVMMVPQSHLALRATGALTRLRVTPLRPSTFIASALTVQFVLGMLGTFLTIVAAIVVFGVELPASMVAVLAGLALGLAAMIALGYTLAAFYPSLAAANGLGNMLMILMMMTSGAFVPTAVLPDGVQTVMQFSPTYHVVQLVNAGWFQEPASVASIAVLAAMTVVLGFVGIKLFKWGPTR
jgi:ABC-2 type transport system permease protein